MYTLLFPCVLLLLSCSATLHALPPAPRSLLSTPGSATLRPLVLWHGMGDSCCDGHRGVGALKAALEKEYGAYVYSVGFGTETQDVEASFIGNVNSQVEEVCQMIAQDPNLQGGYDAIGFGQGGLFLRAVVERCQHTGPKMRLLITLGSQHQGVMQAPICLEGSTSMCTIMTRLINEGDSVYYGWAADHVIQAQYLKDPNNMEPYLENNIFLADINNDKEDKNNGYAENMASLSGFIMFQFTDDVIVLPKETAIFSFHDGKRLVPLQEQPHYAEDWLGLKTLDAKGALHFEEVNGPRMDFDWPWFREMVVEKYLITFCKNNGC